LYKKTFIWVIILSFLLSTIFPVISSVKISSNRIIYVDDDNINGPWDGSIEHPYRNIQDGIDASIDGDTIFTKEGMYRENLNINKAIKLIGENRNNTVINGGNKGIVIKVITDSVTITNFIIKNSGDQDYSPYDSGIKLHSKYNNIYGNIITENNIGIFLKSSSFNEIYDNYLMNNHDNAIEFEDSTNNLITKNNIINNEDIGIFFDSTPHEFNPITSHNTINANNISNNQGIGIYIRSSSNCVVTNNKLANNEDIGLVIGDSLNNSICCNIVTNNDFLGIIISDSSNNSIKKNIIANNVHGIGLFYSYNTTVIDNNFSSNGILIEGNKPLEWDTHTIQDNIANNKEIRYYKNQNNIIIPVKNTGQIILACCSNISIQNQHLSDIGTAIQLGFSKKIHVFNNYIYSYDGISLQESNNNTIEKNNISSFQFGIILEESKNNIIINNTLNDYDNSYENIFHGSGIQLDYSHENNISGNFIYNFSQGIFLYIPSTNNTIYNNKIRNSTYEGLMLYSYSSNNTIKCNIISDSDIGMLIWSSSNTINNNIVTNNEDGLLIEYSNYNTIKYNEIKKNKKYGLYLEEAYSNNILSNNFILNGIQSYYENCKNNTWYHNFWNRARLLPYPIIGKNNLRLDFNIDWHPALKPYDITI
jgi:parallel beta-helix repeat protein